MNVLMFVLIVFTSAAAALLFCAPWRLLSSAEAERMFALVKSHRPDERAVSRSERASAAFLAYAGTARRKLGITKNARRTRRFAEAGWRSAYITDLFFALQLLGLLGGGVLGSVCPGSPLFFTFAGAIAGFIAPDLVLARAQKARREHIRRSVPDMVDLLVVCVGAGLGLDQALLRVGEELRISHPALTEELERVSLERQAGSPRLDAWKALADRTKLDELVAFTSMLTETDRFGTPILKALIEFSEEVRLKRRQGAEEAAAKTKVKIIFPLVLCIFPCLFIVLLAPALLSMAKSFASMGR